MKIRRILDRAGRIRWRVTWRMLGKTRRNFFHSKADADTFAATTKGELKDFGDSWVALAGWEKQALIQARQRAKAGGYTLETALNHYESTHANTSSLTVGELFSKCLDAKRAKGLRSGSLRQLTLTAKLFRLTHENTTARNITSADVEAFLAAGKWHGWRRRGLLIDLNTLFNFGVRSGLLERNPAKSVDRPLLDDDPPVILSIAEARRLMRLTQTKHPRALGYVTLCLFAGVRPDEARRLRWDAIDLDRSLLTVDIGKSKTRARRIVPLHDTCLTWLLRCPKRTGKIAPGLEKLQALRRDYSDWPKNVLRHSYISYELARTQDDAATALKAGNSPDIIHARYKELVAPHEAAQFWAIV